MVKSLISIAVASTLIFVGSLLENKCVKNSFDEINAMLCEIDFKLEEERAVKEDILSLQKLWISKKEKLHIFIPHTEIREIDLWISECVTYAEKGNFEDAKAKVEVVKELCEQIPKTFLVRLGNVL